MKKLKYIATILAVLIALLMSVDESISFYSTIEIAQTPFSKGNADVSHHHTISITDHYFQNTSISISQNAAITDLFLSQRDQTEINYFLASIWQPPKPLF